MAPARVPARPAPAPKEAPSKPPARKKAKTPTVAPRAKPRERIKPAAPVPTPPVEEEPPAPLITENETPVERAPALQVPSLDLSRNASPAVTEQAVASLRWLFFALLGTSGVFLAAVGSRYMLERRTPRR